MMMLVTVAISKIQGNQEDNAATLRRCDTQNLAKNQGNQRIEDGNNLTRVENIQAAGPSMSRAFLGCKS